MVGALLAGVAGAAVAGSVPNPLMWLIAAIAGIIGGLLWALIPALLMVKFSLNEIITTLMMNYVAVNVCAWLVKGPFKAPGRGGSADEADSARRSACRSSPARKCISA